MQQLQGEEKGGQQAPKAPRKIKPTARKSPKKEHKHGYFYYAPRSPSPAPTAAEIAAKDARRARKEQQRGAELQEDIVGRSQVATATAVAAPAAASGLKQPSIPPSSPLPAADSKKA